MIDRKELILNQTKNGKYGTVIINTYLTDIFFGEKSGGKLTLLQEIKRFSNSDENSFNIELSITSALDNTIEEIYLGQKANISDNPLDCEMNDPAARLRGITVTCYK